MAAVISRLGAGRASRSRRTAVDPTPAAIAASAIWLNAMLCVWAAMASNEPRPRS